MKNISISATGQILLALTLGIGLGLIANYFGFQSFIRNWVNPIGQLFIKALKLLAMPLIIVSLLNGFSALEDLSKLSKIGGKTILAYLTTTVIAVILGLLLANIVQPGNWISATTRNDLISQYPVVLNTDIPSKASLKFILGFVPENFFAAAADNRNMLQIIIVSLLFAIASLKITENSRTQLTSIFRSLNELVMKVIEYIMYIAPLAVFALMANVIVEAPKVDLMYALLVYAFTVIGGLSILVLVVYPLSVSWFCGISYHTFLKGILPAQLLGISTSSSAATLPVTIDCVQDNLKVKKEVASFVLPIGATVNMDGTSLYQGVAALFIAQSFGMDLSFLAQLAVVATATLASIGAAAVPGAGIIMLTIVLEQIGVPLEGLALILALDRPLDMLRTAVNITSDAAIAAIVNKSIS